MGHDSSAFGGWRSNAPRGKVLIFVTTSSCTVSASFARMVASICAFRSYGRRSPAAVARTVMSSCVGPSPPLVITMSNSAAIFDSSVEISPRRSATTATRRRVTPHALSARAAS